MSMPPPGGWPPGPPPNSGQPYGQQPFNPQHPPGWQQGQWPQQPSPPPQQGNSLKWLLVAVAVLLVVAISVGATLLFTRDGGGGGGSTPSSGAASDFASAGDTGPVAIVTDEPTCAAFVGINNSLGDIQAKGWGDQRDTLGPASDWSAEQRSQVEAVAAATRRAADQMVPLARQTPHRLVRELYEQFVAYGRAYADSVPNYSPRDNELASNNISASSAIVGICNAITYGSAGRSIGIGQVPPPVNTPSRTDPSDPRRFLTTADAECSSWQEISDEFDSNTAQWQQRDTSIPAAEWTPAQRSLEEATRPSLVAFADSMEASGRRSQNAIFEDLATASAVYLRAAAAAGEDYVSADSWLSYTSFRLNLLVGGACSAASG